MGKHRLIAHPGTPPRAVTGIEVDIRMTDGDDMLLIYQVYGAVPVIPTRVSPTRADGLWKTTCFELFIRPTGDETYFEFNFSPSTAWAAYTFDGYRDGMRDLPLSIDPHIGQPPPENGSAYSIEVDLDLSGVPAGRSGLGLSAVIEETDGTKSYWALAHPAGKPDFHHPDCFVLQLPPASDT